MWSHYADQHRGMCVEFSPRSQEIGFIYDDLIIWNRQAEYNNLKPLGYPSVFRVNRVHEYVLILQKPKARTI